jgi:hypothetical protein
LLNRLIVDDWLAIRLPGSHQSTISNRQSTTNQQSKIVEIKNALRD